MLKKRFKTVVPISLCAADMRIPLAKVSTVLGRSIAGRSQLAGIANIAGDQTMGADSKIACLWNRIANEFDGNTTNDLVQKEIGETFSIKGVNRPSH